MKGIASTSVILVLMLALMTGASGQDESFILVEPNCYGEPESISVFNGALFDPLRVTGVTSSHRPEGEPERSLDITIPSGQEHRIEIGGGNIFDDDRNEKLTVYATLEEGSNADQGIDYRIDLTCRGVGRVDLSGAQPTPEPTRDTVIKTFRLRLDGRVPEDETFGVEVRPIERGEPQPRIILIFCGAGVDPKANAPSCEGDGTTYTDDVRFARGTEIAFRYFRGNLGEFFAEGAETLQKNTTDSRSYFDVTSGQEMPQMPDTGAGGAADSGSS